MSTILINAAGGDASDLFDAAQAEARALPGDDTIVVAGGTYELSRPLELNSEDSGTTFVTDGSEVVLDGGGARISLVTMSGAENVSLSGFTFVNTSGAGTDDFDSVPAAIQLEDSANVTLDDNTFREVALGVRMDGDTNHVTVSASSFTDTEAGAVFINEGTSQNTVTGNTILRSGARYTEGGSIDLFETWGNTVSHNSIKDVPRHGIEEQNWNPANKSGGNTIEFNHITNYMQRTEDGGAIYLFAGDDPFTPVDSTVRFNRIDGTADPFSWGIYMDDLINGSEIVGNVIDGGGVANIMVHGGDRNEVAYNVLLNGGQYGITVQTGLVDPGPIRFDNIHNNIVAPGDGVWGASDAAPQQWHDNIYVGTEGLFGWDFEPFEVWQAAGGDKGTTVIDELPDGPGGPILPPDFPELPNLPPDWNPIEPPDGGEVSPGELVLQMSAEYADAAPEFMVSVDGEEVGSGDVTARRVGDANQSFTFEGEWSAGVHEVSVAFLNDTETRNLWVEDVYFNGDRAGPATDVDVGERAGDVFKIAVG